VQYSRVMTSLVGRIYESWLNCVIGPEPYIRKSCANWANHYVPAADWSNPIT